ncbi:NUDIX hydrolase [Oscillatoria sp. FACHB-1407]|uniref:NUDIX hydrolase n=1 Tax=Oscillatoria sp. FACHB-1407 TaxID=2692847 RepID=UPI0016820CC8|nr:NUDIX hydrolase [Oscillatoria sp. FACHB-1407]MBD2465149.1 NUDIX hydrolase [Oscillatoria sp. FACHB-1407]
MIQLWKFAQAAIALILRHPVTGTSIIPVMPDGRIVLIQRRDNGRWGFPGGMVNWGEDIPTTVERELEEETGLKLVAIRRLVGIYSAPDRDPRFHSICVVIEAEVDGSMTVQDTLEIKDVKAFAPSEIPAGSLSHDHDRQLQDYFNGLTTLA